MTYTVEFSKTGDVIDVEDNETILDACIREGLNQEYSCRVGMCLACIARLDEGDVKQPGARGLTSAERERFVLTCMARPESDLVLTRGIYPPSIDEGGVAEVLSDGGWSCCED